MLSAAQLLLSATSSLVVATGIANVWARDALAMAAGQLALGEAYPDRFILGIGVSHKPLLDVRGLDYGKPLSFMRSYLDGMDNGYDCTGRCRRSLDRPSCWLRSDPRCWSSRASAPTGRTPTSSRPSTPRRPARSSVPASSWSWSRSRCSRRTRASPARSPAGHTTSYLRLPNYTSNLQRLGFDPDEFSDGGNDRLVDTICAWGSVDAVAGTVRAVFDAGRVRGGAGPGRRPPRAAAPGVAGLAPSLLAL